MQLIFRTFYSITMVIKQHFFSSNILKSLSKNIVEYYIWNWFIRPNIWISNPPPQPKKKECSWTLFKSEKKNMRKKIQHKIKIKIQKVTKKNIVLSYSCQRKKVCIFGLVRGQWNNGNHFINVKWLMTLIFGREKGARLHQL